MITKIECVEVAPHRNGISGTPFYAVVFTAEVDGEPRRMLATVFADEGSVAVLDIDILNRAGVAFGVNSWRGDQFEKTIRSWIAQYEDDAASRLPTGRRR